MKEKTLKLLFYLKRGAKSKAGQKPDYGAPQCGANDGTIQL